MITHRLSSFWTILAIALMMPFVVFAQDDDNGKGDTGVVQRLFSIIPDTEINRMEITLTDLPAMFETRSGASMPTSFTEIIEAGDDLWLAVLRGIANTPSWMMNSAMTESPSDFSGFDPFNRFAATGMPPERVELFTDVDASAVIAAHVVRDYTVIERGEVTLLCPPDGCDSGTLISPADRNFDNVFGGDLGRSQPVIVWEDVVISSMNEDAIEAVIATINGEAPAMADDAIHRFVADILDNGDGQLRQFTIFSVDAIIEQLSLSEGNETFPPYQFFAFDDRATPESEIMRVILIYDSADSAARAADVLPARLDLRTANERTHREILAGEDGIVAIDIIEDKADGLSAVVVSFTRPQPTETPINGRITPSAEGHVRMFTAIMMWRLEWLIPGEE